VKKEDDGSATGGVKGELFDYEEFAKQQAVAQEAHDEKQKKRLETEKLRSELEKQQKKQDEERASLLAKIAAKGAAVKPGNGEANGGL